MDETILTLDELKAYLGITDNTQDAELGALLGILPQWIYDITGTWFGSKKTIDETQDYAPVIFLDNMPVIEVNEVRIGYNPFGEAGEDYEVTEYRVDKTGRLALSLGQYNHIAQRRDYNEVAINYTFGVEEVPATVKEAGKIMLAGLYNSAANDGLELSSEAVGSYRKTYKQSNKEDVLLAPYMRVRV